MNNNTNNTNNTNHHFNEYLRLVLENNRMLVNSFNVVNNRIRTCEENVYSLVRLQILTNEMNANSVSTMNNTNIENENNIYDSQSNNQEVQAEVTFNYVGQNSNTPGEESPIESPIHTTRRSFYYPINSNDNNTNTRILSPRIRRRNRYQNSNIGTSLFNIIGEEFLNQLESVPVIPTREQIDSATIQTRFGDINEPPNNRCTISLLPFDEDSQVTQIIHCGHIFNTPEINRWFLSNCRCPICRYDIRNYSNF
jgi:hypothetical protein